MASKSNKAVVGETSIPPLPEVAEDDGEVPTGFVTVKLPEKYANVECVDEDGKVSQQKGGATVRISAAHAKAIGAQPAK